MHARADAAQAGPTDLEAGFRVDQPEPGRQLEVDCRLCGRRFHVAARGRSRATVAAAAR